MRAAVDETGNRYGRLVVIEKLDSYKGKAQWLCKCDCGNYTKVSGDSLRQERKKSCGCFRREDARTRFTTHGQSNAGGANGKKCTRAYKSWQEMLGRCCNPAHISYKNYGARGITVDSKWASFIEFFNDMGERPEGMSLDRVDGSVGYNADNCKWSTRVEQNQNRRSCIPMLLGDESLPLAEWCRRMGLNYMTIYKIVRGTNLDKTTGSI